MTIGGQKNKEVIFTSNIVNIIIYQNRDTLKALFSPFEFVENLMHICTGCEELTGQAWSRNKDQKKEEKKEAP